MKSTLSTSLLKYMVVGASATAVDLSTFSGAVYLLQWDYRLAITGGFLMGVLTNFMLCDHFLFERSAPWWQACLKHYAASLTGLLLNQIGMMVLVTNFGPTQLIEKRIIISTFTFLVNFFLIKTVVFKNG